MSSVDEEMGLKGKVTEDGLKVQADKCAAALMVMDILH
jgi:hypothetical protein